jgi:NADPH2:quinone reductase
MKAVVCVSFGPPEALELVELPEPTPGLGEVVVKVLAISLNFLDTLIIAGRYQLKPPFPFSPAAEFAGEIEVIGKNVTGFKKGERVCGYMSYGAAREKVAVTADRLTKIPEGLAPERAAGLSVTYGTALHAFRHRAQLKAGETLAVLGAAGGVGLAAVEIGKILGARIIACASSADKLAFARKHGADETIDYSKEDLKERLKALAGGEGADVVFDPVGGAYAEPAVRATAWGGRYLVIGFAAGEIPKIPLNLALLKGCAIVGVAWGEFARRDPKGQNEIMRELLEFMRAGRISVDIDSTYPLERTAEAIAIIAARKVKGKVIVKP